MSGLKGQSLYSNLQCQTAGSDSRRGAKVTREPRIRQYGSAARRSSSKVETVSLCSALCSSRIDGAATMMERAIALIATKVVMTKNMGSNAVIAEFRYAPGCLTTGRFLSCGNPVDNL
jgi:hypothetical protein